MVPRTLLPESDGGDGDPLDVIILGPAVPRGSVVEVRPVAVLDLLDQGERDDKILAVPVSGPLSDVIDLKSLNVCIPVLPRRCRFGLKIIKGGGANREAIKAPVLPGN